MGNNNITLSNVTAINGYSYDAGAFSVFSLQNPSNGLANTLNLYASSLTFKNFKASNLTSKTSSGLLYADHPLLTITLD